MICKYYLTLGSEVSATSGPQSLEVSSMISNLGDVEVSHVRVDLGGVVRKISSTIDFVGEARDRLVEMYGEKGLLSSAAFAVYRIENDWTFEKFFECPLDFSTFSYNEHTASCSCLDSSAAAVIKAKKSVKYEFAVADMKEMLPLRYDGLRILNDASFQIIGKEVPDSKNTSMDFEKNVWWWVPRLGMVGSNLINNRSILVSDQEEAFQTDGEDCGWGFPANSNVTSCFAECVEDCVVSIDFSTFGIPDPSRMGFALFKVSGGSLTPLTCGYSNLLSLDNNTHMDAVKWSGKLSKGDKLQYAVFNHDKMNGHGNRSFTIYANNGVCRWYERSSSVDIDVVSPLRLLDGILQSMSDGGERIYGGIKDTVQKMSESSVMEAENARLRNTLLAASESIRNIQKAKITTSFADFCKFMETVFGYVYEIEWKPKSGGGIAEQIVAEAQDFQGFTDLYTNISSVDSPDTVIHYSNTDREFVGVVYGSSTRDCSASFPGYARYQSYVAGEGYRVRTDTYFHDDVSDVYYYATVFQETQSDTGRKTWKSQLHECVIDVVSSAYVGRKSFGSIIDDYDPSSDAGYYSGVFNVSDIKYVRRKKRFVYKTGGDVYTSFPEGTEYNISGAARKDMIFESGGQTYAVLGTSLAKCKAVGGEVETAPYVYFRHRDELFASKGVRRISSVSDFQYEVSNRIYSQIEIGYNKQDYDIGNNGMDEFNFSAVYTIGQKLSDAKLSLISPYRADCYGFEELAEKRGEETTSTDSDGQVFAVFCSEEDRCYTADRTLAVTGVTTETMFNAQLSPVMCVRANERYLASFAGVLKFASTEGNSDAVFGDIRMSSDITLSEPLFGHGNISFSSDRYGIPQDWNGYEIEVEACGRVFRGFLDSLDLSANESEILKFKLIESK